MRVPVDAGSSASVSQASRGSDGSPPEDFLLGSQFAIRSAGIPSPQFSASGPEPVPGQGCSGDTDETQPARPPPPNERTVRSRVEAFATGTMAGNRSPLIARRKRTLRPQPHREHALLPKAVVGPPFAWFYSPILFALSSAVNFACVSTARSLYRNCDECRYPNLAAEM